MRRSIIMCAVVAIGSAMAATASAQANRSVSIIIHGVTESTSTQTNDPFTQTVQDSYNDGTGSPFGINETALSQQTSSINYSKLGQDLDVSVGGSVSFNMVGFDYVQTSSVCTFTFTLNSPATFSLSEFSSIEDLPLGSNGEVGFNGATLTTGTTPVIPFQQNLIPYAWQLWQQQGAMGTPVLTFNGTLAPGTYTYSVGAGGNGTDHEGGALTYTSDFQVAQVPEPVALSVPAVLALALLRPRRRMPPENVTK